MAKSNNLVSREMVSAIKSVLNDLLPKGDLDASVSTAEVVADKRLAKAFALKNRTRLTLMVMAAIQVGQVEGFASLRKRGIHRTDAPKKRAPRKEKPAVAETVATAAVEAEPVTA